LPSRARRDAWLSCAVARDFFLPRSDSDGLSTWVGAWNCSGTMLSEGFTASFDSGKSRGDGFKSVPGLDSLVAWVPVFIGGDFGRHSALKILDWCGD
jgi:hypothetical protein